MKTALLVLCTFVASSALGAEAPEFRLEEPISLDLKDARVTEVITLLGAIAHLPVVIDPAIQGSITIRLQEVPYAAALKKVSELQIANFEAFRGVVSGTKLYLVSQSAQQTVSLPPQRLRIVLLPLKDKETHGRDIQDAGENKDNFERGTPRPALDLRQVIEMNLCLLGSFLQGKAGRFSCCPYPLAKKFRRFHPRSPAPGKFGNGFRRPRFTASTRPLGRS